MIREIVTYPDPALRRGRLLLGRPLPVLRDVLEHIRDLEDTLAATPHGLALASNQVVGGGLPVFVANPIPGPGDPLVGGFPGGPAIDPHYTGDGEPEPAEEACLSAPGFSAPVVRFPRIRATWTARDGTTVRAELEGLAARMFQHECDHLAGTTILDRCGRARSAAYRAEMIRRAKSGRR